MTGLSQPTPLGTLLVIASGNALTQIRWPEAAEGAAIATTGDSSDQALLEQASTCLHDYFEGHLRRFDLPLAAEGTPLQITVWRALCDLPFGSTVSYSELARRIGRASSVRAVANAIGRNPIPIVIPCHRVIGKDGSITGFSGGIERKRWLLEHEGVRLHT